MTSGNPPRQLTDGERLQLLLEALNDCAVYMLDATGRVSSWNVSARRVTGYEAAEMIGRPYSTLFSEEDRNGGAPEQALAAARSGGRFEGEGRHLRKGGTPFWASTVIEAIHDHAGGVVGFAVILRDMTERRATQEALRESERRFRMLVDGVVDYAIFMLDRNGRITNWNAGAERIKGYRADEIIGEHFSRFYTEEDRQAGAPERALEIAAQQSKFESENWRVRKDGSRFWASVVIDAIRDESGELIGFAKVTRDISERREAQEMIERTRAALARSQKLEAIGQLTGGVAHDFNNLLTVITNNLDLILQDKSDPIRIDRLVRAVQRAADRGAKLVQQLLAFGRRQPLRPEVVDPNKLISGFEALLHRACGDKVVLDLQLGPDILPICIDPPQFEAALLNLAFNARDAMPGGGTLRISTEAIEVAGEGTGPAGIPPGRYALVSVADTGLGMTRDVQERAFEPFFTTKEPGKGTGLGLSGLYGFVKQSGGHVTVYSEVGRGTTVNLYLPRVTTGAEAARNVRGERAAAPLAGETILLVEDDPDVLQSTVEMVQGLGYEVLTAGDAVAALAVLKRNVPINILFSDVVMPRGMNGVELAREARKLRPGLRVILSSGYANAILNAEHGLMQDFVFIGKPYRWPDLAEKLRGGAVH